jgi:hypothetical protein
MSDDQDRDEESFGEPTADRPPTPEEERLADEAAEDVDLESVAEHYEEMTERGVHQKGEGRID